MSPEKARPLRPGEVIKEKRKELPNEVLETFNELISRNYSGGRAEVLQKDAVKLMIEKGLSREDIFRKGWLDVEDIYRQNGWKVEYDKPGYNESYEPSFIFTRGRRNL